MRRPSHFLEKTDQIIDHFLVLMGIAHHAAFSDPAFSNLELRFDEGR